jgi:hypothetical protein
MRDNDKGKYISKLRYGVLHSQMGYSDGVSIVMKQAENAMVNQLKIPRKNIFYLVGKSGEKSKRVCEKDIFWDKHPTRVLTEKQYQKGFGGGTSEKVESAINEAKKDIATFVKKTKVEVIIAHNTSHPVNFIMSVALSRYCRDELEAGRVPPKYILWWHDSHLEREIFKKPAADVSKYLLQGIPGPHVDYIIFINTLQFELAKKYFLKVDKRNKGFYERIYLNNKTIHNTTDIFIKSLRDLEENYFNELLEKFMKDYKIKKFLDKNNLKRSDVLFCLQHTRIVDRKKIGFALEFCFEFLKKLRKERKYKAIYFLVSGEKPSITKEYLRLKRLHRELCRKYETKKVFLVFSGDNLDTKIKFEEYPRIFAKLQGFSTYFSKEEGFGNNLLEVLASGLIPVIYTYPIYKRDLAKYNFNLVAARKLVITKKLLKEMFDVVTDKEKVERWADKNLEILNRELPHTLIGPKLRDAILSKRKFLG